MIFLVDSYHSGIIKIGEIRFLARFVRKYLVKETKIVVQYAIVEADVLVERIGLGIINQTNRHINGLQHRLFLMSVWLDGIKNVEEFCNEGGAS